MGFYVNKFKGKYRMSKTSRIEKEDGHGIYASNNPSEQNVAIFRDTLLHMGNASIYRGAAEAQSRYKDDFGRGVDALMTRGKSKHVSTSLSLIVKIFHPCHSNMNIILKMIFMLE